MRTTDRLLRSPWRRLAMATVCVGLIATAALAVPSPARAHRDPSAASGLSLVPVAVLSAAPALVLSAGVGLTVVAVESSAEGTRWLVERVGDGAQASVQLVGHSAVAVGTAIAVTAVSTGWLLSSAGKVVAYVPNALGRGLAHHERVSP